MQFLVEAIVLCLVGGGNRPWGSAFGLTILMSGGKDSLMAKASVPAWAVLVSVGISAFQRGSSFGMFPRPFLAARLDPIEALRHE